MIAWEDLRPVGAELGRVERDGNGFTIVAGAKTDAYTPPDGGTPIDQMPGLRMTLGDEPVRVSAAVTPRFIASFDAGALILRTDLGHWAKLAFERSPDGRTMAVSVVTMDRSDDCVGPTFTGPTLYLRVYRDGALSAFHTSTDGQTWDLLRLFSMPGGDASIDFITQSPMGEGTSAQFAELARVPGKMADFRNGS